MVIRNKYIPLIFILLLIGSLVNETLAAKVTYHVLTLGLNDSRNYTQSTYNGKRLEAIRIIVDNGTAVELPAQFKSPLATDFTYWAEADVEKSVNAEQLYANHNTKAYLYNIKGEDTVGDEDNATPLTPGAAITKDCHIYVTYSYNASNGIVKLDGTGVYNVYLKDGFLAYNRGRNNRPAVIKEKYVTAEQLASDDFVKVDLSDGKSGVTTYWNDATDNKNKRADVESYFFFKFTYEGLDPYNVIIRSTYAGDRYFIEKNIDDKKFVNKYYRGAALFAHQEDNIFLTSDDHIKYNVENPSGSVTTIGSENKHGYFHGLSAAIWRSFAFLNNTSGNGYILMGSNTVSDKGVISDPTKSGKDYQYYYVKIDNNNLQYKKNTTEEASKNHSVKKMYDIKTINFIVKTPFGNNVSASIKMSDYSIDVKQELIDVSDIPDVLKRKYCTFNSRFYKSATFTEENKITKYSEAEGGNIYVDYEVSPTIPFKAVTAADTTWYELTDVGSTQEYSRKIKYDGSANFKNNGASGEYVKASEFAFIGDPYELRVISRSNTWDAGPGGVSYVGVESPITTEKALSASTSATEGYNWDIPNDAVADGFLLRKYNSTGYWNWSAGQPSQEVRYNTDTSLSYAAESDAQTITFNVTGLSGNKYIKVTTGGADQIISVTPAVGSVVAETGTSATVIVKLKANASSSKTITVTIQEYSDNEGNTVSGSASVITITQDTSSSFAGNNLVYSTSNSTFVKVMELPKRKFTYNIVDKAGNIAAKATTSQTIFSPLSVASIPSIILSPFILDETITFYNTYGGTGRGSLSSPITELTSFNVDPEISTDVYVKYTTAKLDQKPSKLNEDQEFNVKLNGHYIYYDKTNDVIKTNDSPTALDLKSSQYLWKLRGRDPYAMLIDNLGAREDLSASGTEKVTVYDDNGGTTEESRQIGAWVKLSASLANDVGLIFDKDRTNAQRFIAKSSNATGIYEVMVATSTVDAGTTYYNIGCPGTDVVKIYNNSTYAHNNDVLKFILNQNIDFTYHLIDKSKHELLTVTSKNLELALPAEYQSPLVGTYYYYSSDQITPDYSKDPHEFTPTDPETKLSNISELYATYNTPESSNSTEWGRAGDGYKLSATDDADMINQIREKTTAEQYYYFNINSGASYKKIYVTGAYRGNHIYVTYEKNDLVKFNDTGSPYMLKFLNGSSYKLEDGNDKLTSSEIKAMYPYCNGDGNLNIYGSDMNKEQMDGGASTRPRWVWFFDSPNDDPYHVRIHSKSTISYKSVSHPTYLQTYAVHFNQDVSSTTSHIVTGGVLAGIASVEPTEYMILGSKGEYRLLTTNPVAIDLNSDGDTNDDGESAGERHYVTSLEQYWKTYNMLKLHMLGISKSTDAFSNDESTWVVPADQREPLNTKLTEKGIGSGNWHSYNAVASAVRWNGYNDKADGHEKKVVENQEHWYQTFSMGNGVFDIESASIPPVLVLLDQHGWEIMRKPLPTNTYPYGDELQALRAYDSPLVEEYKFYSNATKATGCHKYTLRMQNGAERDQIKSNGAHYTSSSLGDLPPIAATGVKDNTGAFNDQYVIYTVKEEYANSYKYHLELHEEDQTFTESGEASKFMILQDGRFYKTENSNSNESYITKPIFEHSNPTGGNVYDLILNPRNNSVDIVGGSGNFKGNTFWYIKPNLNIDMEMGIKWAEIGGGSSEPLTEYETKKAYKDKTGFDPYNIQLQLVNKDDGTSDGRYLTSHMTSTRLDNGIMEGNYTGKDFYNEDGSTMITLKAQFDSYAPSTYKNSEGYDHTNLQISNQTFMAVSDANGNMQLMPRFDHTKRINVPKDKIDNTKLWSTTLEDPVDHAVASADDNESMGPQTVFFVRPQVFNYHIIDHLGNEALSYKRAGDYAPEITDHFKSPLAFDFKYYFSHSAYSSSASSKTSYTAAATSGFFQKSETTEEAMETTAKGLEVVDDFFFRVGAGTVESPFVYKKVTVTTAHSGSTDATYTTTDCAEDDWTNAVAYRHSAANEAAMQTAVLSLANKGLHYYQVGPEFYYYKKVVRSSGENTITISNSTDYTGSLTATDEADFTSKAVALSVDGTYYYKIGPSYTYKKYVVSNVDGSASFCEEVRTKKDISNREITGSFADAGYTGDENDVYVRYKYWEEADIDQNKILQGKWFTIKLADKDVLADGTLNTSDGTGVSLKQGTDKPTPTVASTEDNRKWQWKLLAAPVDPESPLYEPADPYAIEIFNRLANYSNNLNANPNPMSVPIKINSANRFALLSHPNGGYALAAQGSGYTYTFLNGASMTTSEAATTWPESTDESEAYHFTIKSNALSLGAQVILNDDVSHTYTYNVINNDDSGNKIAVVGTQNNETAKGNNYAPYLPEDIQSPLLKATDYTYYGNVNPAAAPYNVVENTKLHTLYGLYDDVVYVRYGAYNVNQTTYKVPNKRNSTAETVVGRDASSKDAALNITGRLPYNIIWHNDNMMKKGDANAISNDANQPLSGNEAYTWQFEGDDPYALKIKHKTSGKYINNSSGTTCTLEDTATPFMLLKKDGYNYGVLQVTEGTNMLSGYGNTLVESNPTPFIIFGLSVTDLIYHLIIAKTCPDKDHPQTGEYVVIPYRTVESGELADLTIYGTTQRDLKSKDGDNPEGSKYQLGMTINVDYGSSTKNETYNYDVGAISIGDMLEVPTEFYRPNCSFDFYIDGIWDNYNDGTKVLSNPNTTLNNKYKGLKLDEAAPRLMSDEDLINKIVRVNIVYSFDKTVRTNTGLDFVKKVSDNLWYTYETYDASTPYLAHYTNAWGLQAMEGRETRYTNDYLWTPLGDPYGFKMYNRYMVKNNTGGADAVMTTDNATFSGDGIEGTKLKMVAPGEGSVQESNAVYELLAGDAEGYFRVHPVINNSGTQYFVRRNTTAGADLNYTILSTTPSDWAFGLDMTLLEPYYERAGYLGGLNDAGKAKYEAAKTIVDIQKVVYDDTNIVHFTESGDYTEHSGYYRLHSVPGTPGISPVRYASGYLHKLESDKNKDGDELDAIPMHFYSRSGVTTTFSGLRNGFTTSAATQGEIPIDPTEKDPSTIFHIKGRVNTSDAADGVNPRVTMSTQGLFVKGNSADSSRGDAVMTSTEGNATTFSLIDIGGAVFLITNVLDPGTRNYLHYSQDYTVGGDNKIYDLKYFHNSPTNEARWCIEPADKKGLALTTNNGGDGYYYTTFYAPYDVKLPDNVDANPAKKITAKSYYAYICKNWYEDYIHPIKVPASAPHAAGKFVPAGTPVIIRTNDDSESIKLSLPSVGPSSSLSSCIFSGEYLEQLLDNGGGNEVYTMGLPFTSNMEKDLTYSSSGKINAPVIEQASSGIGFYINASEDKEASDLHSLWTRNNRYVLHNKIYYRASGGGAREKTRGVEFVPVIFDDEDGENPDIKDNSDRIVGDGCVYDLQGRKVATKQQVEDDTWRQFLRPGIYIINGKKIRL